MPLVSKWNSSNFKIELVLGLALVLFLPANGCKCNRQPSIDNAHRGEEKTSSVAPKTAQSFESPADWRVEVNEKGCSKDPDFKSDFMFKVSNLEEALSRYKLKVIRSESQKCGFTLIKGSEVKELDSTGTDVDLFDEMKQFYLFPDLQE